MKVVVYKLFKYDDDDINDKISFENKLLSGSEFGRINVFKQSNQAFSYLILICLSELKN